MGPELSSELERCTRSFGPQEWLKDRISTSPQSQETGSPDDIDSKEEGELAVVLWKLPLHREQQ